VQSSSCDYNPNGLASEEYQRISGCSGASIPVERDGGSGTACGHWDEECFMGEIMTGHLSGNMAMSTMTLASLEDMGYMVDYSRADPYSASDMDSMCLCLDTASASGGALDLRTPPAETTPVVSEKPVASEPGEPVATEPKEPVETEAEEPVETGSEELVATEPEEPVAETPADVSEPVVPETAAEETTGSSSSSGENAGKDAITNESNEQGDGGEQRRRQRRQLSVDGEASARAFGMSILQSKQAQMSGMESLLANSYLGSKMIVVIYEEAGEIYHVLVK